MQLSTVILLACALVIGAAEEQVSSTIITRQQDSANFAEHAPLFSTIGSRNTVQRFAAAAPNNAPARSPTVMDSANATSGANGNKTDDSAMTEGTDDAAMTEVPTAAPFVVPPLQDCYTDLDDLNLIVRAQDPFKKTTYILCPNTVFDIGYQDATGWCCIKGLHPIWTRADTTFQCGEDGSSTNNCTLRGGSIQVLSDPFSFNEDVQSNVVLRGITFENAADITTLTMVPGEFSFIDCIFMNNRNLGAIKLIYETYQERRQLRDIEVHLDEGSLSYFTNLRHHDSESLSIFKKTYQQQNRSLQLDDGTVQRLKVTYDNCLFLNNTVGRADQFTHYGVIFAESGSIDVVVNNSIFMDNFFEGEEVQGDGFAINVKLDSTLQIHNSCFINNNFVGRGSVLVDETVEIQTSGNYGTNDPNLKCQFVSVGDASCIEYESTTCLAEKYMSLVSSQSAPNTTTTSNMTTPANQSRSETSDASGRMMWGWSGLIFIIVSLFT